MNHGLPSTAVAKIRSVLAGYPQIECVVLYGSRAKGNFKPGSDIDLAICGHNLTLDILDQIEAKLDDLLLPWSIDLCIHSNIENQELLEHINRVGETFYMKDSSA